VETQFSIKSNNVATGEKRKILMFSVLSFKSNLIVVRNANAYYAR